MPTSRGTTIVILKSMGANPEQREQQENQERAPQRGGRGARDRIMTAARELFYRDGIHATGVARIAQVAHVSIRTLYMHFESKNELIAAYLDQFETDRPLAAEAQVLRADIPPRERLVAIFGPLALDDGRTVRGCPFHNAAVEAAGTMPEITQLVADHKASFRDALAATAREAGARDPELLGRQMALLYEGATALSTSVDDRRVIEDARRTAAALIEAALD
jgi:AcrR family transcriptional regulator